MAELHLSLHSNASQSIGLRYPVWNQRGLFFDIINMSQGTFNGFSGWILLAIVLAPVIQRVDNVTDSVDKMCSNQYIFIRWIEELFTP